MNGWIKLHRKIWNSPNFRYRKNLPNLFIVWIWLLTHANEDGVVTFGRNQISQDTGIHPSSVERVVAHFRSKMSHEVKYEANKLYSTITILNWSKYQSQPNNEAKYKRSISEVQPNTNKNKELRIKKNNIVEIQSIYDLYINIFSKDNSKYKLTDKRKSKIKARLKDCGEDMLVKAIRNTSNSSFHTGDNDRGWIADLDFIIRSYEQVEKLSNLDVSDAKTINLKDSSWKEVL